MLKLKYRTLHWLQCPQTETTKGKMKDEKFLYLRRIKMKLDVYKTQLEGMKI